MNLKILLLFQVKKPDQQWWYCCPLKGGKDSSIFVMVKEDHVKFEKMIQDGIRKGLHETTADTTLRVIRKFQFFLSRHFKEFELYDKILLVSNQPSRLHGTAKTNLPR